VRSKKAVELKEAFFRTGKNEAEGPLEEEGKSLRLSLVTFDQR